MLIEIEQGNLATKRINTENSGCHEAAAIKVQGAPTFAAYR
ncbi:hypothetical protein [Terriglobus roseus]|nr:hypothetical protein [Terriglobus roseus]